MVVETFEEFQSELDALRQEIVQTGGEIDAKLVAAWVDKLVISLQGVSKSLALLAQEVEVLTEK